MTHVPTYRYLRLERGWPTLEGSGVEVGEDGTITLARLPALDEALGEPLPPLPGLDGPAGVGVAPCGDLFVADTANHRVVRIDACDGRAEPLPCFGGAGGAPGRLLAPRGVLVGPRQSLYVADSGNARVVVVDLPTRQLRAIWGGADDPAHPFVQPWDLAADSRGALYVADPGALDADGQWRGGRLYKLDAAGRIDAAFGAAVAASVERPGAPASVAVALVRPGDVASERLVVLDRRPNRMLAYALDGTLDAEATALWSRALGAGARPTSVALGEGVLYVADAANGRVLVFGLDGSFRGVAPARGGALGLALDCAGRLVVHPGGGGEIRRALSLPVFAECGTVLLGPFEAESVPTRWQRLQLTGEAGPPDAHVRVFTLTSDALDGAPGRRPTPPITCAGAVVPGLVASDDPAPAPRDRWRAAPTEALDVLALNAPARWLWIAAVLQGDGSASPSIRQMRLTHDEEGWIQFLPALYRRDDASRVFLERALAAFESVLDADEALIDDLPLLFDALAAGDSGDRPTWLEWLAGWVDAELREAWDEATRRGVVAGAFRAHARRGTIESLRRLVRLHTGATPFIEEAFVPGVWSLGASGALGFDTALAAASADGAVLGATARVDRSHLIAAEERGAPLFDDAAHRFVVRVYAAELGGGGDGLARLRELIDREKPAHTTYHLCPIGPRMRVGAQARVGIDTVVGGPPRPEPLGGAARLGEGTVLGETREASRAASVVGAGARVGVGSMV